MGSAGCGSRRVDVIEQRQAVVGRLVALKNAGRLDSLAVQVASVALDVSERTVWRWLRAGEYEPARRPAWTLTEEEIEAYYTANGHVTAAWRVLQENGSQAPSRQTLGRAVVRELGLAERAYARHGADGRRRYELYRRWEACARNEVWEMDHAQLDVEVLPLRGQRLIRPWLTVIVDSHSRVVMGWSLSIHPTTAEVLATVREAILIDSDRGPWGGVPELLRFDGGKEFLAQAVSRAAGQIGFVAQPCAPYSPHQKGKVERIHRTIGEGLIATLPHYTHGPRRSDQRLYAQPAPLSLAQLQSRIRDFLHDYNHKHQHSSLGGMTPAERWGASAARPMIVEPDRLRWMLMADQTRKVLKDGIHFGGELFLGPGLARSVGETVEVRYMPHDLRSIEVFNQQGSWLCTAHPQDQLSPADAQAVIAERRHAAKEMGKRRAAASRKARARTAPLTGNSTVSDITVITTRATKTSAHGLSHKRSNELLTMLGLHQRLNKPSSPADESSRRDLG